jgi:hypothetical protein
MQDHVSRVVGFEGFDVNAVSEEGGRRALKVEVAARARLLPRAVGRRAISRSGPVVRAYDLPIAGGGRSECGEIAASAARVVGGRSPTYRSWPGHVRLTRRFGDVCSGASAKARRTPRSRARSRRPATRSPTRSGLAAATTSRRDGGCVPGLRLSSTVRGLGPAPGSAGAGREGAAGDDVAQLANTGVTRVRDRSPLHQLRAGVGLRIWSALQTGPSCTRAPRPSSRPSRSRVGMSKTSAVSSAIPAV